MPGELRQRGVCVRLAPEHMRCQRALGAALLAREAEPVDAQQIKPVYLRLPQAEAARGWNAERWPFTPPHGIFCCKGRPPRRLVAHRSPAGTRGGRGLLNRRACRRHLNVGRTGLYENCCGK